jgi:hypothetical protein
MRVDINDISQLQSALDESGLPDFITPTKDGIELYYPEGGGCPTISLGDFVGEQPYIDGSVDANGAYITGGEGPYTMTLLEGVLPGGVTGLMSVETEPGVWVWLFEGTFYDEFGIFTFMVGGTDANGCVITPREYTVEVWLVSEQANIPVDPSGEGFASFSISGLPSVYGTGVILDRIEFSTTGSEVDLYHQLQGPEDGYLINSTAELSGLECSPTIRDDAATLITAGSPPYSGTFRGTNGVGFATAFGGQDPNTTWSLYVANASVTPALIVYARIYFKPI